MTSNNSRKQYNRYINFHFYLYQSMAKSFFLKRFFVHCRYDFLEKTGEYNNLLLSLYYTHSGKGNLIVL